MRLTPNRARRACSEGRRRPAEPSPPVQLSRHISGRARLSSGQKSIETTQPDAQIQPTALKHVVVFYETKPLDAPGWVSELRRRSMVQIRGPQPLAGKQVARVSLRDPGLNPC